LVPANVLAVAEAARFYLPAKATFTFALMARLAVSKWRFQLANVVSQSATKAPSKSLDTAATRFLAPRTPAKPSGCCAEKTYDASTIVCNSRTRRTAVAGLLFGLTARLFPSGVSILSSRH